MSPFGRTAEGDTSPVVNLTLDPRRKTLSWAYRRDVTRHSCSIDTPLGPPTSVTPQVGALGRRFPGNLRFRGPRASAPGSGCPRITQKGKDKAFPPLSSSGTGGCELKGRRGDQRAGRGAPVPRPQSPITAAKWVDPGRDIWHFWG